MAKKKPAPKKKAAGVRIATVRKAIKALLDEPEFGQMSEALKQSLAQRIEGQKTGTGVFETTLPRERTAAARPYYNIYRYRFW